jgi:hypothetical protein
VTRNPSRCLWYQEYDVRTKSTGKLVEALEEAPRRGWFVVDMKEDWHTIFQPGTLLAIRRLMDS